MNNSYASVKLSGSILNVNPIELHSKIVDAGIDLDYIHIDVMDGVFVPNKTDGIGMFRSVARIENKPLDVHLMVKNPEDEIEKYNGASIITFHIETILDNRTMQIDMDKFNAISKKIRAIGAKVGIAVKPNTTVNLLRLIINKVDLILVMTVEPGYGGQKLIEATLPKIDNVRKMGFKGLLEVDGGINTSNSKKLIELGANVIVAGTALFGADNISNAAINIKYPM